MRLTYFRTVKPSGGGKPVTVRIDIDAEAIVEYLANRAANARVLDSRKKTETQQARLAGELAIATVVPKHKQEV